ncbi:MAG: ATP-dependent helicase [Actinomycetota bacterium]|nr:ATP-dependent helicase [Actinomycetota bacterium]
MGEKLTEAQREVVAHDGPLRVVGAAGTGKTTALLHRYWRLAREVGPGRVLVVAGDRAAALRFRDRALSQLQGGSEALPITTAWGLSYDIVSRDAGPLSLLRGPRQRALVRDLLAAERGCSSRWPTLLPLLGRRAFVDEVAAAVLDVQAALVEPEDLRVAAPALQHSERWLELAGFLERYLDTLAGRHLVDGAGVLARAAALLAGSEVAAAARARYPHVLVDDHEVASTASHRLLGLLAGAGSHITVAENPAVAVGARGRLVAPHPAGAGPALELTLHRLFRRPAPPALVRCGHPSTEPEAVAAELLAAREQGVPWDDMAVLVRRPHQRAGAITRALARHGIPATSWPSQAADEPAVRALLDLLGWVNGEEGALERLLASPLSGLGPAEVRRVWREARAEDVPLVARPEVAGLVHLRDALAAAATSEDVATLAHRAFRLGLSHLVPEPGQGTTAVDERALDAVVAFLDGLVQHHSGTGLARYLALVDQAGEDQPDPWVPPRPVAGAVTVTSMAAARGQEWHTVVIAGCVEGEVPRLEDGLRFFDRAVLAGGAAPSVAQRRRASLEEERRLFTLARSRATGSLTATAGLEPGVLPSRFVEGWPERPARLALGAEASSPAVAPTAGPEPLWPVGSLSLSASQLATYEDCPLKHAYRYGLGVQDASGVHAGLGGLVHEVLERFLDPAGAVSPAERTLERLHELAEECWRDDLAPYRPQLEEARRDLYDMVDRWWEEEGSLLGPTVVLATERRFDVAVGPHRVRGRIDRVDRADDGVGIRVVDYKTGKAKPRAEDVAEDLQLATYHLAALRDAEMAAWGPPTQLRLLHLRSMRPFDQEVRPDHAEVTQDRILTTASRVVAEQLDPAVDADCDRCELHRLCPLWPEGREVGP